MEDLRFCNEFMNKQQQSQVPQKEEEGSMQEDDFCLKYSGDEGKNYSELSLISFNLDVSCNSIFCFRS